MYDNDFSGKIIYVRNPQEKNEHIIIQIKNCC